MNKIFGIGLSRTGTKTLASALNILGFPSRHFIHEPSTVNLLLRGIYRLPEIDAATGITDLPAGLFFREFDEIYPGSKFIYTIRDLSSWLDSCADYFQRCAPGYRSRNVDVRDGIEATPRPVAVYNLAMYGSLVFDQRRWTRVYREHDARIHAYFWDRPQDLLVLNLCSSSEWTPLCRFLDVSDPVPDQLFPHENARKSTVQQRPARVSQPSEESKQPVTSYDDVASDLYSWLDIPEGDDSSILSENAT